MFIIVLIFHNIRVQYFPWVHSEHTFSLFILHSFRTYVRISLPMCFQNRRFHYSSYVFSEHMRSLLSLCSFRAYYPCLCSFRKLVFITLLIFCMNVRVLSLHMSFQNTCVHYCPCLLSEPTYLLLPLWASRTCVFITLPMLFPNIRVHYFPYFLSWPTFWLFFLCSF